MMTSETANESRWRVMIIALCAMIALYHVGANWYGLLQPMLHTSLHLGAMLFIAALTTREKALAGFSNYLINIVLAIAVSASFFYTSVFFIEIEERGIFPSRLDVIAALGAIAGVLELTRRYYGWPLPIIAALVLTYAFLGDYMPADWRHSSWDLEYLTYSIYMGNDGLFGVAGKTSATLIFTFVLLGAFLEKVGATERIIAIATNATSPYAGGPAKVAILSSGMMGTVSGSSVANVVATGRFTIPLMMRYGYRPGLAAGVEAVASTGGLLMPPIMGAGAFVMAEVLGISYWSIALSAVVPALLYYLVVFCAVHFEAKRLGHTGVPRARPLLPTLLEGLPFLAPIAALVFFISLDISPVRAALYTILFIVGLAALIVRPLSPRLLVDALADGAREAAPIACACACAGIIIGALTGTGFAIKFSSMLVEIAGGQSFLVLLLSMLVVIFLGMALPATASYLVGAAVVAVPLIKLGYPPLAVHLFVFYFANIAHITPPIDLATYAAASIARCNPLVASMYALRLGLIAFVLPFVFISQPVLLLIDFEWQTFAHVITTALAGSFVLAGGLMGWLGRPLGVAARLLLFIAALMLLQPDWLWSVAGGVLALVVVLVVRILQSDVSDPEFGQTKAGEVAE